jgi:hypothetical protein
MGMKYTRIITEKPLPGMTASREWAVTDGQRYLYDLATDVLYRRAIMIISLYDIPVFAAAGICGIQQDAAVL